jgi:PAS domain S-box-containing protein
MIKLKKYSIILASLIIVSIYSLVDIYFEESLIQILSKVVILLIVLIPFIYFLMNRIAKLQTEQRMSKEKEELIRLSTEHAVLYEISDQFMKTYDTAKIMDIAVKSIYEYFNADFVKILIPAENGENLLLVSGIGWMPGYVGNAKVHLGVESQAGYTLLKRRPVMVNDFSKEHRFKAPDLLVKHAVKSGISVPMITTDFDGEKVIGALGVHYKKPMKFVSKDLWFLTLIANETAIAIEKARLYEEINASKDFLISVLEGIGEGVIVIDRDFKIIAANSAYINQEKTPEKVVGEHCYRISHRSEKACHELGHQCPVLKTFETNEPASGIHTHYNSEGKASYVEVHSYPLRDSDGNVTCVVETITDITEKYELEKRLVESEEKYRDLYNNAPDMYFSISADGTIIECNNTAVKILGYKKEDIAGKSVTLLSTTPPEEIERRLALLKKMGKLTNLEAQWKTKNGELIDVILNMIAFYDKDGNLVSVGAIARDVTEKKAIEREMKKKVKELEDFYNMALDREMKMIELKKEIETLKGQSND